ncbi:unnamed protein product [Clonostachys solani]|uniref:Zn(2)-C6 fungal-type domain-containing protein n=1 Tax=Clonostachys solani TaxID=160281 RepID=A0A9P0EDW0_9HYPO|nr:unnamed protein product [Clonostachys solani]
MMSSGSNKRHRVSGDSSSPLRTAIACRACRDRKTRCSGHQPTCTYCFKAGVPCEYGPSVAIHEVDSLTKTIISNSSSSNLDEWGARILDAIDSISIPPVLPINSVPAVTSAPVQGLTLSPQCIPTGCSPITGVHSILKWQVFNIQGDRGPVARYKQALSRHADQRPLARAMGRESATCATETLLGLVDIFQAGFLPAIPVLDAADLRRYILHIGEYGDMWNVEACLVLIVAALASMLAPTSAFAQHASSTVSMALRYWNMAKKRLAWALEESGIMAAQCQLLAAIWYIHTSEPTVALKMLNGSLLAIDTKTPKHGPSIGEEASHRRQQDKLCDNIRYMCISLLCLCTNIYEKPSLIVVFLWPSSRLQCEVTFSPTSTSYNLQDRNTSPRIQFTITELLNSLLLIRQSIMDVSKMLGGEMSIQELGTLHQNVLTTAQSLDDWYTRLPDNLKSLLADPLMGSSETTDERSELEAQSKLLQWQYLEARELVLRPSLYLTLQRLPSLQLSMARGSSDSHQGLSDVVQQYYITQFHSMMIQHRNLVVSRLRLSLNHGDSDPQTSRVMSLDMGWLKTQTYLSLGLMLIASMQCIGDTESTNGRSIQWGPDEEDCILALENWSRNNSEAPGLGVVHADLLRDLYATLCKSSAIFP